MKVIVALLVIFSAVYGQNWSGPQPINVCIAPDALRFENEIRVATVAWNGKLKTRVFQMTTECEAERTTVVSSARIYPWIAISFPPSSSVEPLAGDILLDSLRIWTFWDFSIGVRIMMHELGHILGLVHSREENSIMWPTVHKDCRITDKDVENAMALWSNP